MPQVSSFVSSFKCRLCGHAVDTASLSLGRLPVCNRFEQTADVGALADIDVVECETCQLIQLRETAPIDVLTPRLPWIRYREPEGHLDAVADAVLELRPQARRALGAGPFEQPLLSRLSARGLSTAALELDVAPAQGRYPYLETWQAGLNPQRLAERAARLGTFDLVSCRYIVEHTPSAGPRAGSIETTAQSRWSFADRSPRLQQIPCRTRLLLPLGGTQLLFRRGFVAPAWRNRRFRVVGAFALSRGAGRRAGRGS